VNAKRSRRWIFVLALIILLIGCGPNKPVEPPAREWYRIYFTNPGYPDKEAYHHGGLDEELVSAIGEAKRSILVAAYDFDLENVAQALIAARERGVAVRMVTDTDNADEGAIEMLKKAGIPVVEDGRGAIMHDKFVVIDGKEVWMGSWNLTTNGTYRNNNSCIVIASPSLAENYTAEFEEMFEKGEFGPTSPTRTSHPRLTIAGAEIETYFAPEDEVAEKIIAQLKGAERSIYFMAFSFTDDRIGDVVKEKFEAGVKVGGVFESRGSGTKYSEYKSMRQLGMDVWLDGNRYIMHHKVFIIDEETAILGSYNFTRSADEENDENILIIHDPTVASHYLAEYRRVCESASGKSSGASPDATLGCSVAPCGRRSAKWQERE